MAKKKKDEADNTPQGNIKIDYNTASTGLNMDNMLSQIPKGSLSYSLNASVENYDSNSISYQNEPGNEFTLTFPEGYILIGKHFINEASKHIFFLTNPETGGSQIGYMDNNDGVYHTLIQASCLNFNINYPIHKVVHRITNCILEIYWTDGFNPRRYLDLNSIPYLLTPGSTVCNSMETSELDCNAIKLQPNFSIPSVNVTDVISGGNLISGDYQFAVQYSDPVGNPFTSYYSITNPTPIADPFITTINFNYNVGKSIVINVNDLDVTGHFEYFNLAVIKTINDIASVDLVGTFFIDDSSKEIIYTGQNVTLMQLTIEDIFEKFPFYDIAQDLTAVQDVLIWDQLSSIDRINYQQIWSKVTPQWETYRIPPTEDYSNELNATNLRSYLRDEVYALEGCFLLKNGKQTDGFHIPGRAKNSNEILAPNILNTNPDFIGEADPLSNSAPYWKIYNTATVIGFSPEYQPDVDYKGPYQYGEFAYWESTEEYPCNTDVWGDLVGQKIRHHKFPDVLVSPINESANFSNVPELTIQNTAVYPIGIKIDVDQIKALISQSNLTTEQKADIVGFKILRGNRGTNKSIIAKGMLRNVNKYTRDKTDYYFPNYPYNDLKEDPFINKNNNAYLQECKSFTVNITALNTNGVAEVTYTDCNTNKLNTIPYTSKGTYSLCSLSVPLITPPAKGSASESIYDVWRIASTGNCFIQLCAGWRAQWIDPSGVLKEKWVRGCPFNDDFEINVKQGEEVGCIDDCDHCGITKYYLRTVTDDNVATCDIEIPLTSIESQEDLAYRQIFNSPETSFGQPFLGSILKLENVMFGRGKAHFVEVEKNAKYKLLTKEAQEDALTSAYNIANVVPPVNASAMFAAYQAYLTIYINGITRKNYAYSFNSIASYDYNRAIPNNLGVKQRRLDISRYLIPNVISTGDNLSINNFNRETSVYLKTQELSDQGTVSPLPFPSKSPNMLDDTNTSIVTDNSRFTISDTGNCSIPQEEEDIEVVSYYASLKNNVVNQWGQIYTYETIDTGFQVNLYSPNPQPRTIFGGDTFISRFAYKTKLPFFNDNRVNAPDDSDIFYDEIGNVGFPKYWHSARSVLSNFTVPEDLGILYNIVSYKAHNFDCPNSQVPGPPALNPNRTFYDGYYYLFAYGIPSFYCETAYNLDLRQAFNNKEGDFFPHVGKGIPDKWLQEYNVSILNDNTYYYNITYSKQNKENFFSHLPTDWSAKLCFTHYPFRAIYSDPLNTDADNRVNNWLIYRAISYFDFPQNYGRLISLDGIQNRAILARFDNKSLMYDNLLTIDTSNPQAAYIGNPTLFKKSAPIDFAETDLGYVGSQNKFLLKIPQGQITIDAKRGQIFLITGTQAQELTAYGSGMNRFFTDHLAFEILRYFPTVSTDNHFSKVGLHGVFDTKFERVIITKLDYIPLTSDIIFNEEDKEFYIKEVINDLEIFNKVELNDPYYFCNKSWTISFNMNTKSWISFHSYLPNFYIGENNFFYSGINECCTDFDCIVGELVPTPTTTTTSTSTTSSTTTSTTTITPLLCAVEGEGFVTDCELEGEAIITVPPEPAPCTRPEDVDYIALIAGYNIISPASSVNSTASSVDACSAVAYINGLSDFSNTTYTIISGQARSIILGETVYAANELPDCTVVPDGWYFTDEYRSLNQVFHIVDGVIIEIVNC